MKIPSGALLKSISPHYNSSFIPRELLAGISPPQFYWWRVRVEQGRLEAQIDGKAIISDKFEISSDEVFKVIKPIDDAVFYIEHWHSAVLNTPQELLSSLSRS